MPRATRGPGCPAAVSVARELPGRDHAVVVGVEPVEAGAIRRPFVRRDHAVVVAIEGVEARPVARSRPAAGAARAAIVAMCLVRLPSGLADADRVPRRRVAGRDMADGHLPDVSVMVAVAIVMPITV